MSPDPAKCSEGPKSSLVENYRFKVGLVLQEQGFTLNTRKHFPGPHNYAGNTVVKAEEAR